MTKAEDDFVDLSNTFDEIEGSPSKKSSGKSDDEITDEDIVGLLNVLGSNDDSDDDDFDDDDFDDDDFDDDDFDDDDSDDAECENSDFDDIFNSLDEIEEPKSKKSSGKSDDEITDEDIMCILNALEGKDDSEDEDSDDDECENTDLDDVLNSLDEDVESRRKERKKSQGGFWKSLFGSKK